MGLRWRAFKDRVWRSSTGTSESAFFIPVFWQPGTLVIRAQLLPHRAMCCHYYLAAQQLELALRIVENSIQRFRGFRDLFELVGATGHTAGHRVHSFRGGYAVVLCPTF